MPLARLPEVFRSATLLSCLAIILGAGCSDTNKHAPVARVSAPQKLVIFAAASTQTPIETLAKQFETQTKTPVSVTLGSSSGLAKQIDQEADADIFLSADQPNVEYLRSKQLVAEQRLLLSNRLVVAVPADSSAKINSVADLAQETFAKIALAEAKVPAGEYARQALDKAGVREAVEKKAVGGIDVKATLQLVALGEVEAGFVYRTDAVGNPKVRVALEIPADQHRSIVYPLVLIRREKTHAQAKALFEYLTSPEAARVFSAAHFEPASKDAP